MASASLAQQLEHLFRLHQQAKLNYKNFGECSRLEELVRTAGLFSANEGREDLSAGAARLVLVDYLTACCIECRMEDRLLQLKIAEQLFVRFIARMLQYELVDVAEGDELRRLFATDSEDRDARLAAWLAATSRSAKIDRMKRLQGLRQEVAGHPIPASGPRSEEEADSDALYWRRVLNCACLDALERLSMLLRETELLQSRSLDESEEGNAKPRMASNAHGGISKITQSFQLVRDRMQVAAGVFRPGHSLPTMTIDEYLDLEQKRGNIITGGGEASRVDPELKLMHEDTDAFQEAQVIKDRQWDEFKDWNSRGSGNTYNRS